ncbi:MAG TPA: hypothetical protein VF162_18540 [Streptosporangiaceae bacterium]
MSFFDSIPQLPPPGPEQWRRPSWVRPDTVIPASVPAELLLFRTDQAAVSVGSVRAYPNGFEFTVHTRLRRVDTEIGPSGDPFSWHRRFRGAHAPGDVLRLGLLYADGRRTATTRRHHLPAGNSDDGELVLTQQGGGGSARAWDQDFWVHPLPPDGPVTLVASWLEHAVTETRTNLDGTQIRAAAARAVHLWPDEPDTDADDTRAASTRISHGGPIQKDADT